MRGGTADDFECARLSQLSECCEQIAFPFVDKKRTGVLKHFEIEVCKLQKLRILTVTLLFARTEIDQQIQMSHVTLAQKLILKHRAERWCERHRQLERHRVLN